MRKRLLKFVATVVVLITLSVGLAFVQGYEMNLGVVALKLGNGEEALSRLGPLARLGDGTAQFQLGCMYALGWGEPGVPRNDKEAIYWFERAGFYKEKGVDPAAPAELGVAESYAKGTDGVKADPVESAKWLRLAAAGGSKEAVAMLRRGTTVSRP